MFLEVADIILKRFGIGVGVVGVRRWKMGKDAGSIDPLPEKGVVGKLVELAPGNLLGQKIILCMKW